MRKPPGGGYGPALVRGPRARSRTPLPQLNFRRRQTGELSVKRFALVLLDERVIDATAINVDAGTGTPNAVVAWIIGQWSCPT